MKIFLTGGNGFVGKNLIDCLASRHELIVPTHQELDLLDEEAVAAFLERRRPDVVIHCANIGATKKTDALPIIVDHNVRMFLNLARCERFYRRMVFYGSGAEFDKRRPLINIDDDFISQSLPITQYGLSKYLCSHFIGHFPKVICLRIFGIFGKYDDYENRFVSNAVCRAVKKLPIVIYRDQLMSFVCADDLAKITGDFLSLPVSGQFFNVCDQKPVRLLEIAELIKKISGKDIKIVVNNPGMEPEYSASAAQLKNALPDFQFADFSAALKAVYSWYAENEQLIDSKKFFQ